MTLLLRALLLRPLLRRPWRFAVTALGVAAGVAAVVATVASSGAAVASLEEGVREVAGRARLELTRPGGVDESLLARLRPLACDAVIVPVIEELALLPALGQAVRVLGLDLPVDRAVRELGGQAAIEERAVEALLQGRAALLPDRLARRVGLQPGDRFALSARSRLVTLEVAGVVRPSRLASAWDRAVVVDVALAQEMFGRQGRVDRIELLPLAGVELGELQTAARAAAPPEVHVAPPDQRAQATGRMVRALEFNLTALSGISLLVGGVLIATTLATSVVQRRELIALARSLGASGAQIAGVVAVEAVAIGVLGGVLGVAGGVLGARGALASVRATVASIVPAAPATPITLAPELALAGLALAVLVSLAAAALPVREALTTPPVQGLRAIATEELGTRSRWRAVMLAVALAGLAGLLTRLPPLWDLPVAALAAALAVLAALLASAGVIVDGLARLGSRLGLAATTARLAASALATGRRRAAWAAGAVAVTVALAVAIATMVGSFRSTVVDWASQAMRSDVWVRPAAGDTGHMVGRLDPEVARVALELFGPEVVDPFHTAEAFHEGRRVTLGAGEMAVIARRGGVPFVSGRDSREVFSQVARDGGAIVNEPFSRRFGIGVGDTVRLRVPRGLVEREVAGVFYDYSHSEGMVVIDRSDFLRLYPNDGPQEVALFLPEGSDPVAARDRLLEALGGRYMVAALLNRELREEVLAIFDRTFAITEALRIVAVAVAVVAVLTVLFALIGERARELSVLRALGASRSQLGGVVLAQAGLLGVAGAVGGALGGLTVGLLLVRVVNVQSFGWTLRFLPPWSALAFSAGGVLLACLAAGLAPAIAAARKQPGEGLREE